MAPPAVMVCARSVAGRSRVTKVRTKRLNFTRVKRGSIAEAEDMIETSRVG
jgi:hypothetical protein